MVAADYKQFYFADKKWGIAVIETVNPEPVIQRLNGLQTVIKQVQQQDKLGYFLVIIVDILTQRSYAIMTNDSQNQIIQQAFSADICQENPQLIALGDMVSRKKQFVPTLETYYQNLSS